jgi:dynein heavy chain
MNQKKVVVEGEEEEKEEDEDHEEDLIDPKMLQKRVETLIKSMTYEAFNYAKRGLFERHKLLIATILCMGILVRKKKIYEIEVNAFIKKEIVLKPPHYAESLRFIPKAANRKMI